jgi:hypothetical protein
MFSYKCRRKEQGNKRNDNAKLKELAKEMRMQNWKN